MRRKKDKPKFTADELKALRIKLNKHADELWAGIRVFASGERTTGAAYQIRDRTDPLNKTHLVLDTVLDTVLSLAEMTGDPQDVPWLDECGLEDQS